MSDKDAIKHITLSYSHVIDWNLNDCTVSRNEAEHALIDAADDPEIFTFVETTLDRWEAFKLSFGVCCNSHAISADFTPRRGHPLARDYNAFIRPGESITDAVYNAAAYWEAMFGAWLATCD